MVCLGVMIPTTKIPRSATKSIMTATVKSMRTSPTPTERDCRIASMTTTMMMAWRMRLIVLPPIRMSFQIVMGSYAVTMAAVVAVAPVVARMPA